MMKNKHKILRLLCAVVLCGGLIVYALSEKMQVRRTATEEIVLESAAARESFLNLCGWTVTEVSASATVIPQQWQMPEGQYWLMLQGQQGLSPQRYGGKTAMRYCYHIENIVAEGFAADLWYAELLLCDHVLVGAQVYCAVSPDSMQAVR
ncbi:MAG: DUF4830 domain-containing protein [Oscillospiraceae bacterium]|nr:DUF4830 domain-containing protein [Oscillospiraceae bacterium]